MLIPLVDAAALCAEIEREPVDGALSAGDERITDCLANVSRRLLDPGLVRRHPELAPLGFFLRPAELTRTLRQLDSGVRVPYGLVFHVPPANVDTVFVYSWALSALMGNRNIVRLSPRSGAAASVIVGVLADALRDAHPAVAQTQRIVTYDRSDEITATLSAACDLRVIWGGDEAVRQIRRHPLAPHARDLTFPDRSSFAVISTTAWQDASDDERDRVVEGFANDAYWFDQAACSSPRTIFWVGPASPPREDFTRRLAAVAHGKWAVEPAMAVEQRASTYGLAADGLAADLHFIPNSVATFDLPSAAALPRRWLGLGVFAHCALTSLDDLVPVVSRKDQTMTHFGFPESELVRFARAVAGRGVDRIVPVGSALTFEATWDGVHLPTAFSRIVTVRG